MNTRDNSNYIVVSYNAMVEKPPIPIWTRAAQNQTTWAKENSFPSRRFVSCHRCLYRNMTDSDMAFLQCVYRPPVHSSILYCTYTDYRARKSVGGGGGWRQRIHLVFGITIGYVSQDKHPINPWFEGFRFVYMVFGINEVADTVCTVYTECS